MVPHGDGPRKPISQLVGHDVGPLGGFGGGPLLTKTLLFVGQGGGGRGARAATSGSVLKAYDKSNGKVIANVDLPAAPSGTPMTYLAGGKQFVVVATNAGTLVAFSLRSTNDQASAKASKPKRPPIYNEKANAQADIDAALALAKRENKRVLLKFGGNWCGWCYKLHDVFTHDAAVADVLNHGFVLVLVDVNSNKKLFDKYAPDEKQPSFPYLVVLDADGKILKDEKTEELEEGPKHNPAKVKAFLVKWSPSN
jgi:thiol-disulfide isomerase/thioredoxin